MHCMRGVKRLLTSRRVRELVGEMDADDEAKVRAWISIHREDLFANWELLTT